jgi:hypothetical protein
MILTITALLLRNKKKSNVELNSDWKKNKSSSNIPSDLTLEDLIEENKRLKRENKVYKANWMPK